MNEKLTAEEEREAREAIAELGKTVTTISTSAPGSMSRTVKVCLPRLLATLDAERARADAAYAEGARAQARDDAKEVLAYVLAGVRAGIEAAAERLFRAIPDKVHPDLDPADEHGWSLGVRYQAAHGAAAIRSLDAEAIARGVRP